MQKEGVKRHDKPSSESQVKAVAAKGVWEMEIPGKLPAKQPSDYSLKKEGGSGSGALVEGLASCYVVQAAPSTSHGVNVWYKG